MDAIKIKRSSRVAQATLEFAFGMVVAVLLLMGMVQVLIWTGQDLAKRREEHERFLRMDVPGWIQTSPAFYYSTPIFAAAESNIFGNQVF